MSLESYNKPPIALFFEIAEYKHLPKVLLALAELKDSSTLSGIQNCLVSHRQWAGRPSLSKTLDRGIKMKLLRKNKKFELTELGKQCADFLKKGIGKFIRIIFSRVAAMLIGGKPNTLGRCQQSRQSENRLGFQLFLFSFVVFTT